MSVKPSDTVTVQFTTTEPTTGAAADADSLPTGTLVRNGANTAEAVSVSNITTGVYSAAVTIPAGYAAGDEVQIRIAATVGGVTGQGVVWTAQVDELRLADVVDAVWDEVLTGATHNVSASAGRRLRELGGFSIRSGTAQAGAGNSITLDAGASATDQIYDNNLVVITGGTGAGQTRVIVEYNGTTKVAIVDEAWEINPDATSEFQILAAQQTDITHHGIAQAGAASTITLSTDASTQDDIYNGQLVLIRTSTGSGQARLITDYDGATRVATIAPDWNINPTSNSVYAILPFGRSVIHNLDATALAAFITDDTGETTAVAGSVAKIAQGAAGLTVQDIWGHTTRTLTQGAASVTAAVVGDEITVYRGTTMSVSLTGLGDLSGYSKLYFSVKRSFSDSDDDAILRVSDEASGLEKVNGADPTSATNGTITIDDVNNGDITITVDELETAKLSVQGGLKYDVKGIGSGGDVNLLSIGDGKFNVSGDVTRAIT